VKSTAYRQRDDFGCPSLCGCGAGTLYGVRFSGYNDLSRGIEVRRDDAGAHISAEINHGLVIESKYGQHGT